MNTIYVSINNLEAVADEPAVIVSDNTGYQIEFDFDDDWADYVKKNRGVCVVSKFTAP